jgi:hypothetical protein
MKTLKEFITEAKKDEYSPEDSHLSTASVRNFKNTHGTMYNLHRQLLGKTGNVNLIRPKFKEFIYHPNARAIVQLNLDAAAKLHKSAGEKISKLPHDMIKDFAHGQHPKQLTTEYLKRHVRNTVKDKDVLKRKLAHIEENKPTYQKALDIHLHLRNAKIALAQTLGSHEDDSGEFVIRKDRSKTSVKLANRL